MIGVIKPGTSVNIVCPGVDVPIPAKVASVQLSEGDVIKYECVYWNGRDRKVEWLSRHELSVPGGAPFVQIGFER